MTDERESRRRRASDAPMDLTKEREAFVRTFLRRGVELTDELVEDNKRLRDELKELRETNARLRSHVASDDAIRDLLASIEGLEKEKRTLLERSTELEADRKDGDGRYLAVERELNELANLYIVSMELHASLSTRRVVRHLLDTLGQLVGAYSCVVYVVSHAQNQVLPIASENVPTDQLAPVVLGEGPIGEACLTGLARVPHEFRAGTVDDPMAIVPLLVDRVPVGAITILTMLEQKTHWESVDGELFKLLASHGGNALVAANLYADTRGPLPAINGLREHLERRTSRGPAADE